jgi:hypothetical protein
MNQTVQDIAQGRIQQARVAYRLGLELFNKRQWKDAAHHFSTAAQKGRRGDIHRALYQSYHGLAQVYAGDSSGLNLCRHAAGAETIDADVFLNLALAELHLCHRKRACSAVALGLRLDPRNARLAQLRKQMGTRRQPCLPFLKRGNALNKWLGKVTFARARRKASR